MKFNDWLGWWIAAWMDLICGLISVITFCMWRPWWDFSIRAWWGARKLTGVAKGGEPHGE